MKNKYSFGILLGTSLAIALAGFSAPRGQMPLNYYAMVWRSIPLACLWAATAVVSLLKFRKRGLWVLLGALLALYWPLWLLMNGLPECYYSRNCD